MAKSEEASSADTFAGGNALELVSYQTGSVVSRTIVKEKTGTVTVFAFDKGQSLSEHTAPFVALAQVLDGVGEITVDGRPNRLGKNDLILLPANVPHAVKAIERFKMMLVMIRDAAK